MLIIVALAFGGFYFAALAALFVFQRDLLFMPDKTLSSPSAVGLTDTDTHRLLTSDGIEIIAWLARAKGGRLAIYFHGNGGSLAWRAETIATLRRIGVSVLAIDYRGFGGSGGSPSEAGLDKDANAAYAFALKLGYAPSQIILFGESLGSGVAISLATRSEVAALILDSAYSSIADVAADRYWMFPVRTFIRDSFQSVQRVGNLAVPILMIHGTADTVVPYEYGRKLFAAAGPRAQFITIDGAGHLAIDQAESQVRDWLTRLPSADDDKQIAPLRP